MEGLGGAALITGASGMLGCHLISRLKLENWEIHAIVRRNYEVKRPWAARILKGVEKHYIDLTLEDQVEEFARSYVEPGDYTLYHLVGALYGGYRLVLYSNWKTTANLLYALSKYGKTPKRIVYVSSLLVLGDSLAESAGEDVEPKPKTAYEVGKFLSEKLLREASKNLGFELVIFRPVWIYGEYSRSLDLNSIIQACTLNLKFKLERKVDFYMIDAKLFSQILGEAGRIGGVEGVFNIAEPKPYSLEEIFEIVCEAAGSKCSRIQVPEKILSLTPPNIAFKRYLKLAPKNVPLDRVIDAFDKPKSPLAPSRLREVVEWVLNEGVLADKRVALRYFVRELLNLFKP